MLFAQCTCTHIEWIPGPAFAEQNWNLMSQLYMVTHCIVRGGTIKERQVDLPSKIKTHADPVVVKQTSELPRRTVATLTLHVLKPNADPVVLM